VSDLVFPGGNLNFLTHIYAGVYLLFSAWTISSDVKEKEPFWDIVADLVLLPMGGIGILLFVFGVDEPGLKSTWKLISIVIVAGQVFTNVVSRYLTLAGKTSMNPAAMSQWTILAADLVTVLFLAPMFFMNILFAFR
jgi:hypothetical protein